LANKQLVAKLPDRYRSCHFILERQEHLLANKQLVAKFPDRYTVGHAILFLNGRNISWQTRS
jgi:hypothetical protein